MHRDRRLVRDIIGHEVQTVPQMGWATIKNGDLLAIAKQSLRLVEIDKALLQHNSDFAISTRSCGRSSSRHQRLGFRKNSE